MNRLLVRRCSMSSIEEEDESAVSDELITQIEKLPSLSLSLSLQQQQQQQQQQHKQPFNHSPSVLEWDSELSESEQEFDDNNENLNDNGEQQAANRALQNFIQSCSRTHQSLMNNMNDSYSPLSIHLYDEEDSAELDVILSELRDFKVEFDKNSNLSLSQQQLLNRKSPMNHYPLSSSAKSSSSFSTNGCVHELRTLEDQLEAALASLTLTVNDCTLTNIDSQQQRSSDSSACSSGLGDEIGSESFHLYNTSNSNHHTVSFTSKITATTDDCDSAFSDSGSNDKVTLPNPDESIIYRSITNPIKETPSIIIDQDDSLLSSSHSQHPSKILIRTYNDDGSTKSIFIDDSMLIRDVLFVLIQKNHREADINYALIEILPDLHMERIFEDHQKLTEAILMWPTISSNRLRFTTRFEKYTFFQTMNSHDEFYNTPDIEGNIYLKEKSRKSWKKYFCVLRSSGLYFIPKGKSKKDLICLAKFENVELFFGFDWKKKFKSPSDFCFALKHPLIQKKSSKYIKYMCVDTKTEFDSWIRNIRMAKFGQQLKINYLLMDQAIHMYRLSGRLVPRSEMSIEQPQNDDLPVHDRRTPIPHNQYHSINEDSDENSPIKSASYMDELRQRLERVLNDPPQQNSISRPTLIPPPKLKSTNNQIKPPITIGSTPLPRKQIQSFGNLSYRTMNTTNRQPQQQMSKSFIIPSKQEVHRNASLLSITSKSDSINLDETDFSVPSSTFLSNLNNTKKLSNSIQLKPTINTNMNINGSKQPPLPLKKPIVSYRTNTQSQSLLPIKNGFTSPSLKLSTPMSPIPKQNKPITNNSSNKNKILTITTNNKAVPPVPPRKSSIPRPPLKPQPPQRNSSTNLLLRKSHVSHL